MPAWFDKILGRAQDDVTPDLYGAHPLQAVADQFTTQSLNQGARPVFADLKSQIGAENHHMLERAGLDLNHMVIEHGVDMDGVNTSGMQARNAHITLTAGKALDLRDADFSFATIESAFSMERGQEQNMLDASGTTLAGAKVSGEFGYLNITGADATRLNAQDVRMYKLDAADATLDGAQFTNATLTGQAVGADIRMANFTQANLVDMDLSGADLSGANLNGATLTGVNLAGANLAGLQGVSMEQLRAMGVEGLDSVRGVNADGTFIPMEQDVSMVLQTVFDNIDGQRLVYDMKNDMWANQARYHAPELQQSPALEQEPQGLSATADLVAAIAPLRDVSIADVANDMSMAAPSAGPAESLAQVAAAGQAALSNYEYDPAAAALTEARAEALLDRRAGPMV